MLKAYDFSGHVKSISSSCSSVVVIFKNVGGVLGRSGSAVSVWNHERVLVGGTKKLDPFAMLGVEKTSGFPLLTSLYSNSTSTDCSTSTKFLFEPSFSYCATPSFHPCVELAAVVDPVDLELLLLLPLLPLVLKRSLK